MKTSTIGNLSEAQVCHPKPNLKIRGYTLIELTVVILLIGLTVVLTVPKFRYSLLTDDLKSSVRRMIGTIRTLRNEAVRERQAFMLHFDLETNRLWVESAKASDEELAEAQSNSFQLPEGVRIMDVWSWGRGKETSGETAIRFTEKGYVEPSVIHLKAMDGREFTLILSPFLGKVEVLEEYVDFVEL
ncbi:MAG: prepilin-type N-terminal cleavage/methylation domain-containing protein [Deltaproteobacteria bacterium]|nr:prepilin-type N-terminal cleavage/methylation domain-containing protein [Deltaproteobacteria bacterium]